MSIKKNFLKIGLTHRPIEQERLFDEIYWSKASKIKKQAFFLVGPNFYEDAVQEVFVKIYKKISGFKRKSHLDTWIHRITLNTCLDILRKNKKTALHLDISNSTVKVEEIEGLDPIKRKAILEGLETLNEKHKTTFVLFFIMELKISEVAEILKVKEGTVKSRVFSAKKEMRDFLIKKGVYDE